MEREGGGDKEEPPVGRLFFTRKGLGKRTNEEALPPW